MKHAQQNKQYLAMLPGSFTVYNGLHINTSQHKVIVQNQKITSWNVLIAAVWKQKKEFSKTNLFCNWDLSQLWCFRKKSN